MCNLCRYLNTIDVNQLSTINPWSDEEDTFEGSYGDLNSPNPWPSDEESSSKTRPVQPSLVIPKRRQSLQRIPRFYRESLAADDFAESFLLDSMVSALNSAESSPRSSRHLGPDDFPSFQISTISSSDNFGSSRPYEMSRPDPSTISVNTKVSSTATANASWLKKRGHRRSTQVLSASSSSPTGRSPRDSLDGLFTPSPLSAFSQPDAVVDYFSYKK